MKKGKKILYVGNCIRAFLRYRFELARAASEAGYDVHVAMPLNNNDGDLVQQLEFPFHVVPLQRANTRIIHEIKTIISLSTLYKRLQPDIVHHHTIKPVLYGGFLARLLKVPSVVSSITGLGYIFLSEGLKVRIMRTGIRFAYRVALGHNNMRIIFQNPDDRREFLKEKLVDDKKTIMIKGSGVDVSKFTVIPEPDGIPVVTLAARMLWDKGICEFVEAAKRLKDDGVKCRFVLVGASDSGNPSSISQAQLKKWHDDGDVEWWGWCDDMQAVLAESNIACLPSYGEGMPLFLLEAAACGRPVVTTDVYGCREVVEDGENGLLVQPRDSDSLAAALQKLIEDPMLRRKMGVRGREIVQKEFTTEKIIGETLNVYNELLR